MSFVLYILCKVDERIFFSKQSVDFNSRNFADFRWVKSASEEVCVCIFGRS